MDDDDDFGDFIDAPLEQQQQQQKEEGTIKVANGTRVDTIDLLRKAHQEYLPIIDSALLKPLSTATYQLRKRILSNKKTKEFIKGYIELMWIIKRIMAGRRRMCPGSITTVDKTARHVEQYWFDDQESRLNVRVKALGNSINWPVLNSKIIYDSVAIGDTCLVCGLARNENLEGDNNITKWVQDTNLNGHKSCINFYSSDFQITSQSN